MLDELVPQRGALAGPTGQHHLVGDAGMSRLPKRRATMFSTTIAQPLPRVIGGGELYSCAGVPASGCRSSMSAANSCSLLPK